VRIRRAREADTIGDSTQSTVVQVYEELNHVKDMVAQWHVDTELRLTRLEMQLARLEALKADRGGLEGN
jgi:hypothetical protein